jgi:hypothetical protein
VTKTETPSHPTGTIIHAHGHPTRLVAAVRSANVIQHVPLATYAPAYEEARTEAETKFPGLTFVIPRLGESPS